MYFVLRIARIRGLGWYARADIFELIANGRLLYFFQLYITMNLRHDSIQITQREAESGSKHVQEIVISILVALGSVVFFLYGTVIVKN